jgi:hypothetical protein
MTTCPTPNFKLDPKALADTVPLRRVGTDQVRLNVPFVIVAMIFNMHCRIWPELLSSWRVELVPMLMALCGSLTAAGLAPCPVITKNSTRAAKCISSIIAVSIVSYHHVIY